MTTEEAVESHIHKNLEKPIVKSTPTSSTADKIANVLITTLADWSKNCAEMRHPPKFSQAHTEVRVSHQRKRLRLNLVGIVRWSYKKPKDIFGVEIKSSLSDFESDRKCENYLNFYDFFCFAIFNGDSNLRRTIENRTDNNIGILEIEFRSRPGNPNFKECAGHYRTNVFRKPKRIKLNSVGLVYETLYERVSGWSSNNDLQ